MLVQAKLLAELAAQVEPNKTYWLGYSGGLDSHVLLHLLWQLKAKLQAVYIDHGLSPYAQSWARHGRQVCFELGVPFTSISVDARPKSGQSPEEAARHARYTAFAKLLQPGDYLLTAHHQDDQAETLLLQMLRGTGIKGMMAMPMRKTFARGFLLRPLLNFSRAQLLTYAQHYQLHWIEDESNHNLSFDRNYIRHQVMPLLQQRWPRASNSLTRCARHAKVAEEILAWYNQRELEHLQIAATKVFDLNCLQAYPVMVQLQLLRTWLAQHSLSLLSENQLLHLLQNVIYSKEDAKPRFNWAEFSLRRYQSKLYILPKVPAAPLPINTAWDMQSPLTIADLGSLQAIACKGKGINTQALLGKKLSIRFRQGGERCQPSGRQGSHPLKKLWQEWGVPPWQRSRIPLLYADEQLAAVVGFCVCQSFAVTDEAIDGYEIVLQSHGDGHEIQ